MRLLLLLLPLAGCVAGRIAEGEPFLAKDLEAFRPGETTAAEVTRVLGPPRQVVDLSPRSAYLYESAQSRAGGLVLLVANFFSFDQRFDRIWLFFDGNDVLTHYGAKFSSHRVRWDSPWSDLHAPDKNARKDEKRARREAGR